MKKKNKRNKSNLEVFGSDESQSKAKSRQKMSKNRYERLKGDNILRNRTLGSLKDSLNAQK